MSSTIHSTTGTVKYRLKDVKSTDETSIILDYSFGRGNRIKYATGFKTLPKYWDANKQRIRGVSTIKNRDLVNNALNDFSTLFTREISNLDEIDRTNKILLKALLDKIIRKKDADEKRITSFFDFADNYIVSKENQSKQINSVKLSPITVRSYKQTVNRLKDFNNSIGYNLDFHNINLKFYYAFIHYLEMNGYSKNTIGKHIKNLITILNRATEEGYNKNLDYKHREFKSVSEQTVSIYLTEKEIDALYNVDLSRTKDWELARDIFMIGYYTGQRVSDYNGITPDQIQSFDGREVFEFRQKKTNKIVYVPIHPKIRTIMKDRYGGKLPRKLNAPDINEYIKEAGRKAQINQPTQVKKTVGGKIIKEAVPKHKLIVSHTARRSFCTNAYLSKMPTIDIMAISGHSTEREFYKYIKITHQERAVKIADSAFFSN